MTKFNDMQRCLPARVQKQMMRMIPKRGCWDATVVERRGRTIKVQTKRKNSQGWWNERREQPGRKDMEEHTKLAANLHGVATVRGKPHQLGAALNRRQLGADMEEHTKLAANLHGVAMVRGKPRQLGAALNRRQLRAALNRRQLRAALNRRQLRAALNRRQLGVVEV
jgi:hypothetical protein